MGRRASKKKARRDAVNNWKTAEESAKVPRVNLVPSDVLKGSVLPVNYLGPDHVVTAFGCLKRLVPAEELETLWLKCRGGAFRLQHEMNLMIGDAVRPVWHKPLELFRTLGKACKVSAYGHECWVVPPRPHKAIELLERLRLDALAILRVRLGGAEHFMDVFRDVRRQVWQRRALGVDVGQYVMVLDSDEGIEASLRSLSEAVVLSNLLVVWCRKEYNLTLPDHESWVRGRAAESALLSTKLCPREEWHPAIQEAIAELEVYTPRLGKFVQPGVRDQADDAEPGDAPKRTGSRRVWDPERLLFYIGLDEYVEPRALEAGDRFGYIAVQFRGNRIGLDTALTNNRFFGLEGNLEECLQLARLTKREIRDSPLCKLPLVHRPDGSWRTTIRQWVRGELDLP